jgi:hypothetical protein
MIFTENIERSEPLEENIDCFTIDDENGDDFQPLKDFYSLQDAKDYIDRHAAGLEDRHGWNHCPIYTGEAVLPNENKDCSMCGAKLVGENIAE